VTAFHGNFMPVIVNLPACNVVHSIAGLACSRFDKRVGL
jgi:hypothetical protein